MPFWDKFGFGKKDLSPRDEAMTHVPGVQETPTATEQGEQEKRPVKILVADDKWSDQIKGFLDEGSREINGEGNENPVETCVDLKTALVRLESGEDDVVITDLYFPYETGSNDKSKGDEVLASILIDEGCDPQETQAYIEVIAHNRQVKAEANRAYQEVIASLNSRWEELKQAIKEAHKLDIDHLVDTYKSDYIKDASLLAGDLESLLMDSNAGHDFAAGKLLVEPMSFYSSGFGPDIDPKFAEIEQSVEKATEDRKAYIEEESQKLPEIAKMQEIVERTNDKELNYNPVQDLIDCQTDPDEANQPMGILLAQKAKEIGKPVVIVTGHHELGQYFAMGYLNKYLRSKGVIEGTQMKDAPRESYIYKDPQNRFSALAGLNQGVVNRVASDCDIFIMPKGYSKHDQRLISGGNSDSLGERHAAIPYIWKGILNRLYQKATEQEGR